MSVCVNIETLSSSAVLYNFILSILFYVSRTLQFIMNDKHTHTHTGVATRGRSRWCDTQRQC